MKRSYTKILLFILLVLPVLIFFFLKIFGENYHDIPVYYQEGVDTVFNECNFPEGPHLFPEYNLYLEGNEELNTGDLQGVTLYFPSRDLKDTNSRKVVNELKRAQAQFTDWPELNIVTIEGRDDINTRSARRKSIDQTSGRWYTTHVNHVYLNQLTRCGFVLDFKASEDKVNTVIVLVDEKRRIRGYYEGTDINEVDRLILEIQILKNNW